MRSALLFVIVFMSSLALAASHRNSEEENFEVEEIRSMQEGCGSNILCYFTQKEVKDALGAYADQSDIDSLFQIGNTDFSEEQTVEAEPGDIDLDFGTTEISAKRRTKRNDGTNSVIQFAAKDGSKSIPKNKDSEKVKDKEKGKDKDKAKGKEKGKDKDKEKEKANRPLGYKGISPIGQPIWASFVGKFRQCAQGCIPYIVSVNRPGSFNSCHYGGRAIDVAAIVCEGESHFAIKNTMRFNKFVNCMGQKMKKIYRNGNPNAINPYTGQRYGITYTHYDHAHFSNGCVSAATGGRMY